MVPEVKRAQDRESRDSGGFRGGGRGRGRGFAARGLSAAGLTRGHGQRNGDGGDGTPSKGDV